MSRVRSPTGGRPAPAAQQPYHEPAPEHPHKHPSHRPHAPAPRPCRRAHHSETRPQPRRPARWPPCHDGAEEAAEDINDAPSPILSPDLRHDAAKDLTPPGEPGTRVAITAANPASPTGTALIDPPPGHTPAQHGPQERSCRNQGTPQKLTGRSANSPGPTTPHGHGSQLSLVPRRRRWTGGLRTAPAGRPRRRSPARPGPGRGDARLRRRRAGHCLPRRAGRRRWSPDAPRRRPRTRRPR